MRVVSRTGNSCIQAGNSGKKRRYPTFARIRANIMVTVEIPVSDPRCRAEFIRPSANKFAPTLHIAYILYQEEQTAQPLIILVFQFTDRSNPYSLFF